MSNPNLTYRPDIDGLRALAVLGVVIYHAFPTLLPGGFVGVDVFFVISGFLIGTILLKSMERGTFSFADFYSRRIRRIFPALLVVLAFTLITGHFVLLDDEYRQLGKQVAAGSAFMANFAFWSESGYFDTAAELKPLLHLWSLAIEEQFYLLWPLFLWAGWKLRASPLLLTIVIAAISFAINVTQVEISPVATFFLLPSRAWELLAGSILAWAALQNWWRAERSAARAAIENASSLFGVALIVLAMFYVQASDAFPGWYAAAPVVGAVMLIAAGPQALLNKLLFSNRLAVFIGLISFPLYLWHWPLLSFARIVEGEMPTAQIRAAAVALSIILAWLTYVTIERPLRAGKHPSRQVVAMASIMLLVGVAGYKGFSSDGSAERTKIAALLSESKSNCDAQFPDWSKTTDNPCRMQKKTDNSIAIVGDSHAGQLYLGLSEQLKENEGLVVFAASCAAPYINTSTAQKNALTRAHRQYAYKLINSAYDYIINEQSIKVVVLAHHPVCSYNDAIDMENPGISDYKMVLENGMRRTVSRLTSAGKKVIVVFDNPVLTYDPSMCNARPFRITKKPNKCSFPRIGIDRNPAFNSYKITAETTLRDVPGVVFADLSKPLCDSQNCYISKNGVQLYMDKNHLNDDGSRFVAKYLINEIRSIE
ncbi:acyltransferase [Pseudomonas putida]|nr:acyltransferase [Pseudomonas putida]